MSKRNSLNSSNNTLFNYFTRSPAAVKNSKSEQNAATSGGCTSSSLKKAPTASSPVEAKSLDYGPISSADNDDIDGPEEIICASKRKRSRIFRLVDSSDSNDSDQENERKNFKSVLSNKYRSSSDSPVAKKKLKIDINDSDSKKNSFEERLLRNQKRPHSLAEAKYIEDETDMIDAPTVYLHSKLDFIKPENIRDKNKRRPADMDYDPGTLFVPTGYLEKLTPAMRQWWQLKSENFDSILFFKVGKFYELYHMDADVGVRELGFTYMKGDFAHSGFPEQSFDRMASSLVNRGFKVARCEQTETPEMMTERVKHQHKPTKFDKVVNREICQVINRGTQVFGQQIEITKEFQPNYMMAVVEKVSSQGHRFGIAFIDTSIGEFTIGEFDDDQQYSRLLTLFAHNPPVLLLYERGMISPGVAQIFKSVLSNILKEALLPDSQFWKGEKTLQTLAEKLLIYQNGTEWPDAIKITHDGNDHLGLTPNNNYRLALKALGGCIWYLTKCVIDEQILAMARFTLYVPPDSASEKNNVMKLVRNTHNMVLDSITLSNLKIVGEEKSLFHLVDNCCTKFAKRLLNFWICSPSCDHSVIMDRQGAIRELMSDHGLLTEIRQVMGKLPDLERHLAQIHTFGNKNRSTNHPDGRAILYEQKQYNKKKIHDFISTIVAFDTLAKIPDMFSNCSSRLLQRLTQLPPNGEYPDFKDTITFFKNGFDFENALKEGVIAPGKGVDMEFDAITDEIKEIESQVAAYLITQEKYFGCRLQYVGNDKKRYELEVPESNSKKANERYSLEGQRKGAKPVRRFSTCETRQFLKSMLNAEDRRNHVLKDLQRRMFEKFSTHFGVWKACIDRIAIVDCLTSLAIYGQNQKQICFPEVLPFGDNVSPVIEIENGYHPCMVSSDDFIPNGIILGGDEKPALALLTGPNMGGKSTLMRQVGLLVILAQIGSPIPAVSARLSLIDRIFTRLGAQDDILAGQSTFLVELSETSAILKHATVNSLILLDELGRGTATYDGTAIAGSVVDFLANLKCRSLFSTHYHNLVDNFYKDHRISLGHMACMVESEGASSDPTEETVTFLYKYSSGSCPKSYGFNAAKLAGMPLVVIKRAHQYSKKVESIALKRKLFSRILSNGDSSGIRDLLSKIQACGI